MTTMETGFSSSRSISSRNRSSSSGPYLTKVLDHRRAERVFPEIHEKAPLPGGCRGRGPCELTLVLAAWLVEERFDRAPAVLEVAHLLLEVGSSGQIGGELARRGRRSLPTFARFL